jgi:4-hydroxy-tetrahydrodipicolinate synthase
MNIFSGIITALVTPFDCGKIDFLSLEKLLLRQMEASISSVVLGGSTGEGLLLNTDEYRALLEFVIHFVKGKINVFASCTALTTDHSVLLAKIAQDLGANGLMCSPPPYIRATQTGIIEHFKCIHDKIEIPMILYSVPQRTGVDFTDESMIRIISMPKVVAVKDAGNDLQRILRISQLFSGKKIQFLCGNDLDLLAFSANGGAGCISVASNIAPKLMIQIYHEIVKQQYNKALELHKEMIGIYRSLCIENNPTSVKYILSLLGLCNQDMRPPLTQLSDSSKTFIKELMQNLKQSSKIE